jgi:protein-S-isoprenylcysteine O-methyltransferase Ste14
MFRPHPISLLQFATFWVIFAIGAIALIRAFARNRQRGDAAKKSARSRAGIIVQMVGFAAAGAGPIRAALRWQATSSLVSTALVILLGGGAVAIFIASTRAMGKNWSVVARTRSDHELVRSGPFAVVRHPIYLGLFMYLESFAIAFGHWGQLLVAIPFYWAGTIIRVREEEKLLRAQFGEDHARYVRDVPAFIPFVR